MCFIKWFAIGLCWRDSNFKYVKNCDLIFFIVMRPFKKGCHNIRNVSIFRTIRDLQRQNNIMDHNITADTPHTQASNKISVINGEEGPPGDGEGRRLLSGGRRQQSCTYSAVLSSFFSPLKSPCLSHWCASMSCGMPSQSTFAGVNFRSYQNRFSPVPLDWRHLVLLRFY